LQHAQTTCIDATNMHTCINQPIKHFRRSETPKAFTAFDLRLCPVRALRYNTLKWIMYDVASDATRCNFKE
jgi:hypothetical protein